MPLNTTITRDGEAMKLHWGGFHIAAMVIAAAIDSGTGPWVKNTPDGIMTDYAGDYPDAPIMITSRDAFTLSSYPVIGNTPLNDGPYTLKGRQHFVDAEDGEVLDLLPGDVLHAYRSHD